ncbi:MAG TPA: PP2C family serine/threonine-protein phosphatase [Planctomycetaceae bacterium]|nr:PP2C family serine/threonine-protein phosphatase [Planctomycetaceae bacterium]
MRWEQQVQYASISDIGFRRRMNQDSYVVQTCSNQESWRRHGHLFLVADGMGGHAVGELASKIAADTIPHTFFKIRDRDVPIALRQAIEQANATIHERGTLNVDFERMGTTCTALVLGPQGAIIGHVGDSRVYRIRGDRIEQLSFDHSLQWELLRQGRMRPEEIFLHEPRHVITRSLGPQANVQVDVEGPYAVLPGDVYVLCSDGLTGHVVDSEIGAIARELPPGEACRLLVHLANLRGGSDNITVLIARVGNLPEGVPPVEPAEPAHPAPGAGWAWLAALWAVAIIFVTGVSLALLEQWRAGAVLAGLGVAGAAALTVVWWKQRPQSMERDNRLADTVVWSPYRTASSRMTPKLLSHLVAVESELQRTAIEEGWEIDRDAYQAAYDRARQAFDKAAYPEAFREYARAIDALMAGVHIQRRQLTHQAKWGRTPTPPAHRGP